MRRLLLALFAACSLGGFLLVESVLAEPSRRELTDKLRQLKQKEKQFEQALDSTLNKRTEAREKFQKTKRKENNLLELISRYRELQQNSKRRLEILREREQRAKERLREIDKRFEAIKGKLEERENLLKERLRSIYKQGQLMQARTLVDASNFSEFLTNYRYYRQLVDHDKELMNEYRQTKDQMKRLREERRQVYERRKNIRQEVQKTLQKRREILDSRQEFLEQVRNKKELYRQRLRELEQRQDKLKDKVILLQRKRTTTKRQIERITGQFGKRKGELPWPVDSREILRPFGTWRENGIIHNNDGIDVAVQSGEPVEAVSSGKVVFASKYRGIGKVVIVRHNDSYITLYGSLIELNVSESETVDEGQVLGRAGRTAGMDHPRLYFQIFEGKRTLDPQEWLK